MITVTARAARPLSRLPGPASAALATCALALALLAGDAAQAQDRQTLGTARLFSNDKIGDGEDRWRSGAYQLGLIRGPGWAGARPDEFGAILEYRLRTEIIAPGRGPGPCCDRPYVGAISAGVHSHSALGPFDLSLGVDAVAIGPQTGVSRFQEGYHDALSLPDPPGTGTQLENAGFLTGTAELAWPLRLSETVTLRPFAEAQAGAEDFLRVGADMLIGDIGHADLLVRDAVTGQLLRGVESLQMGWGFVIGADWTQVDRSRYLPADLGYAPEQERIRARFGVHWQLAPEVSFFYGATYLSEEFEGQDGGQTVGSVKLNFNY